MSLKEVTSHALSLLTYNGLAVSHEKNPNIYMGIGLWSNEKKLSKGLPIDIIGMLLAATAYLTRRKEIDPSSSPKLVILVADSMALQEGSKQGFTKEDIDRITCIYRKSLEPLLKLLKIGEQTEIVLASDLEKRKDFRSCLDEINQNPRMQEIEETDPVHSNYVRQQSAITRYMEKHLSVGMKLGWRRKAPSSNSWDELTFDRFYRDIFPSSKMQYVYAKAGLRKVETSKQPNTKEACPYTAFEEDRRYVINTTEDVSIATRDVYRLNGALSSHWDSIIDVCSKLKEASLVDESILPEEVSTLNSRKAKIYRSLDLWVNLPTKYHKLRPLELEAHCKKENILL